MKLLNYALLTLLCISMQLLASRKADSIKFDDANCEVVTTKFDFRRCALLQFKYGVKTVIDQIKRKELLSLKQQLADEKQAHQKLKDEIRLKEQRDEERNRQILAKAEQDQKRYDEEKRIHDEKKRKFREREKIWEEEDRKWRIHKAEMDAESAAARDSLGASTATCEATLLENQAILSSLASS